MNFATWILIGESFLILVSLVIAIAVYTWRKKRRLLTALDVLLTNLSKAEPERIATLTERLKNTSQIDEAKANLLSDEIFCAERQFIQKLIQLLLSPGADKIAGFNQDIYALVTPYWELLSSNRVADGLSAEQSPGSAAVLPVSLESESDDLPSEDYDLDVSVAAAKDLEAEPTSTLTEPTPDIDIDEEEVVASSEVADQSIPTQDSNESDQNEESNQTMPVPPVEELPTDEVGDDTPAVPTQDETEQISESMEPGDSEGDDSSVADIIKDEYLAEETTDSVEAKEEDDEPSWDDAFDEAAQTQEAKVVNLGENEDGKSKKVPEF